MTRRAPGDHRCGRRRADRRFEFTDAAGARSAGAGVSRARLFAWIGVAAGIALAGVTGREATREPIAHDGYIVLAGDFHVHGFPDGIPPWDAVREARRRRLDVIALTSHNSMTGWWQWTHAPVTPPEASDVMVLPGEELTSAGYHLAVVGLSSTIPWRQSLAASAAAAHAQGAIAILAHPTTVEFQRRLTDEGLRAVDGVEVGHPGTQKSAARSASPKRSTARHWRSIPASPRSGRPIFTTSGRSACAGPTCLFASAPLPACSKRFARAGRCRVMDAVARRPRCTGHRILRRWSRSAAATTCRRRPMATRSRRAWGPPSRGPRSSRSSSSARDPRDPPRHAARLQKSVGSGADRQPFRRESRLSTAMMIRRVCALALIVASGAVLSAAQRAPDQKKPIPLRPIAPLDLPRTLDLYAAGHFDEAVQAVAKAGDEAGRNLRRHWAVTGAAWIDAEPGQRPKRLLAAAALALETEGIRAERGDWRLTEDPPCAAACVLDWAQVRLVERGAADAAERAWYLAAAALAGGVRDSRYLHRPVDVTRAARAAARADGPGARAIPRRSGASSRAGDGRGRPIHSPHRRRHAAPGPPRHRRACAAARSWVARDASPRTTPPRCSPRSSTIRPSAPRRALRLGYLHWAAGDDEAARAALSDGGRQGCRSPTRAISRSFCLAGSSSGAATRRRRCTRSGRRLTTRPGSQSAAMPARRWRCSAATPTGARPSRSVGADERRGDLDPWRQFLYGHHPHWPRSSRASRRGGEP